MIKNNFGGEFQNKRSQAEIMTIIVKTSITSTSLQTHHVYSTSKRGGNYRFHVISTWNTHGVFIEIELIAFH